MKTPKNYTIEILRIRLGRDDTTRQVSGTLEELKEYFGYTLECGRSWQYEKGNKKIPRPEDIKGIKTLIRALNNSKANTCRYYQDEYFSLIEA